MDEPLEMVLYWVDDEDVVVDVGGAWDDFARKNDGATIVGDHVRGKRLWSFIQGDATRMLLSTLLDLVRVHGKEVSRPYRCDSPTHRRYMEMRLSREQGRVKLENRLLEEVPMSPPVSFRYAAGAPLIRCSMCNGVKIRGEWLEASEAAERGEIASNENVLIVYGVCGDCAGRVRRPRAAG